MPLAQIVNQGNINLAALQVPGVIVVIVPPPLYGQAQPTDTGCVLGTGSWGIPNVAYLMGSSYDTSNDFGGINGSVAYNDPHDLATHANIAFMQANGNQASLQLYGIRVTDGTDTAASVSLNDTTSVTPISGGTLTAVCTGVLGQKISATISAGQLANTFTIVITAGFGAGRSEIFKNIPGSTGVNSTFWVNLANRLASGDNTRGPSQLVRLLTPSTTAKPPALSPYTLSGGTDGRGVTSSNFVGVNSTDGVTTGLYAMQALSPAINQFWCAGLTDNTVFATQAAMADTLGAGTYLPMTKGMLTSVALSTISTLGIIDYNVSYVSGDYLYWYDAVNGALRLVEATPFLVGRILCLSPEQSPGNKFVQGVVGSLRNNSTTGCQPYTSAELGQLTQAGIQLICNPINAGAAWGIFHDKNSSQVINAVTGNIQYSRMINFLAKSYAAMMGVFVSQLQSNDVNDPLRQQVKLAMDTFCTQLKKLQQIDAFLNICDQSLNTTASVAQRYLFAQSQVRFLATADFIVINLMGGTTELGALQVSVTVTSGTDTSAVSGTTTAQ